MATYIYKPLILLAIFLLLGSSQAMADQAKIEAIGGAKTVAVKRDGKSIQLKVGDVLQAGDELVTDDHTGADLRFEDQTLVRVGVNSSYKIVEDAGTTKFMHRLFSGIVRVLVPVKKEAKTDEIKFKMKTPQGTIGVRGTEFTVTIAKDATILKGLSGEVQFGPENADFADKQKFVYVGRGFESSVAANKPPAAPKAYDMDKYIKEIDRAGGVFGGVAKRSNLNVLKRGEKAPIAVAMNNTVASSKSEAEPAPKAAAPAKAKEKKEKSLEEQLIAEVIKGSLPKVAALVTKGANVNYQDDTGSTPLHYAVLKEKLEIVQYLIEKGAKVNAQSKNGVTPLMQVAIDGAPKQIADLLIQNNADANLKNVDGFTAYDIAKAKVGKDRDEELVEFLKSVTQ